MRLNDETALQWMIDSFDIDRDASRIALRDGEPLGFANLAIRGDEAWVGGVGVVPAARRQGIGELLMHALHDEARARGIARIWLEVIEQNEARVPPLREARLRRRARGSRSGRFRKGAGRGARATYRSSRRTHASASCATTREPWQRADATLAQLRPTALGLETRRRRGRLPRHGHRPARPDRRSAALKSFFARPSRSHGDTIVLNLPTDDPAADALRALGGGAMSCGSARWSSSSRGLDSERDGAPDLPRHSVRLVAAARRQRARRRHRERASRARPRRDDHRVVEPRGRSRSGPRRAAQRVVRRRRARRSRARGADLAAQPRRRAGRRANEPLPRAPVRPLRRRARLRARPAEPVVPRAAGRGEPRGRDVLLAGAPVVSTGARAAGAAARPDRRAARRVRGDGHRRGRTLPGRVPDRLRGRRHDSVRAGGEGAAHRARVAADRAPADARRRCTRSASFPTGG